jgi:L-2-hydroxycarboxylate dehydrogenase (NAD+)
MDNQKTPHVSPASLQRLCLQVFQKMGVSPEDARIAADVLVAADLRGVDSHGVAHLDSYVDDLRDGVALARPSVRTLHETPVTALIDAGAGLGHPVSHRAMRMALQKALDAGAGFVAVRNSNHYGIASYYAMMALQHDCIGISLTNAFGLVVPTFGRAPILGTNPIAVAVPAGRERPFVLDMATSTVPHGKLEIYDRLEKALPPGWAVDATGAPATDPRAVMESLRGRAGAGGGLLPLGGAGELLGGHKGYGLALLVDILCGVLPGALYADLGYPRAPDGTPLPSSVGHFFGALRVDAFRPLAEFKAAMDDLQRRLKDAPTAAGHDRIYVHGEKEFEQAECRAHTGIPLHPKVLARLQRIATDLSVDFDPHGSPD